MKKFMYQTLSLRFNNDEIQILDQTLLPFQEEWIDIMDPELAVKAIQELKVRGAPLIGVVASLCFGIYCRKEKNKESRLLWWDQLLNSRPTAVNLIHHMKEFKPYILTEATGDLIFQKALEFFTNDQKMCDQMANHGFKVISKRLGLNEVPTKNFSVLTHCNTGALATAGEGTALAVIKKLNRNYKNMMIYVDETRPLLQGARLTTWELTQFKKEVESKKRYEAGVSTLSEQIESVQHTDINPKFELICDNMAAFLMLQKKVDAVVIGADRITSQGDTANKIGSYGLAVLCHYHKIPFYIVAPTTTIDSSLQFGSEIPIEQRDASEVRGVKLSVKNNDHLTSSDEDQSNKKFDKQSIKWALDDVEVYNPAFDWVPADLITGWITEEGFFEKEDIDQGCFKKYKKAK